MSGKRSPHLVAGRVGRWMCVRSRAVPAVSSGPSRRGPWVPIGNVLLLAWMEPFFPLLSRVGQFRAGVEGSARSVSWDLFRQSDTVGAHVLTRGPCS